MTHRIGFSALLLLSAALVVSTAAAADDHDKDTRPRPHYSAHGGGAYNRSMAAPEMPQRTFRAPSINRPSPSHASGGTNANSSFRANSNWSAPSGSSNSSSSSWSSSNRHHGGNHNNSSASSGWNGNGNHSGSSSPGNWNGNWNHRGASQAGNWNGTGKHNSSHSTGAWTWNGHGANHAYWNSGNLRDHNVSHFNKQNRDAWRHGHWRHGRHHGRNGWWWNSGGTWFFYNEPIYPYPGYVSDDYFYDDLFDGNDDYDVYSEPDDNAPPGYNEYYWYYCSNPAGYYPYVKTCRGPWRAVTPTPDAQQSYDQNDNSGADDNSNNGPPPDYDNDGPGDDSGPPPQQ